MGKTRQRSTLGYSNEVINENKHRGTKEVRQSQVREDRLHSSQFHRGSPTWRGLLRKKKALAPNIGEDLRSWPHLPLFALKRLSQSDIWVFKSNLNKKSNNFCQLSWGIGKSSISSELTNDWKGTNRKLWMILSTLHLKINLQWESESPKHPLYYLNYRNSIREHFVWIS